MSNSYLVEVKPSVLSDTSLTPADFDPVSNLCLSEDQFEERLLIEFTSREDAESWVRSLGPLEETLREGKLRIQGAHSNDDSNVDAYLLFHTKI